MDRNEIGWMVIVAVASLVGFFASRLWEIWEAHRERIGGGGGLPPVSVEDAPAGAPSLRPVSIEREGAEVAPRIVPTAEPSQVRRRDEVRWSCPERVAAWAGLPERAREALAELGGAVPHERIGCPLCLALARGPCDREAAGDARHLAEIQAEVDAERPSVDEETRVYQAAPPRKRIEPGRLFARPRLLRPPAPPEVVEDGRATVPARRGGAA